MKKIYYSLEGIFEKISTIVTSILGNSITFFISLIVIVFWLVNRDFRAIETIENIRDLILALSFLTLFIIQKSFSRFSGSLNLKVNELVASTKTANNAVMNVELKTELEVIELQKEYTELAEQIKAVEEVEKEQLKEVIKILKADKKVPKGSK